MMETEEYMALVDPQPFEVLMNSTVFTVIPQQFEQRSEAFLMSDEFNAVTNITEVQEFAGSQTFAEFLAMDKWQALMESSEFNALFNEQEFNTLMNSPQLALITDSAWIDNLVESEEFQTFFDGEKWAALAMSPEMQAFESEMQKKNGQNIEGTIGIDNLAEMISPENVYGQMDSSISMAQTSMASMQSLQLKKTYQETDINLQEEYDMMMEEAERMETMIGAVAKAIEEGKVESLDDLEKLANTIQKTVVENLREKDLPWSVRMKDEEAVKMAVGLIIFFYVILPLLCCITVIVTVMCCVLRGKKAKSNKDTTEGKPTDGKKEEPKTDTAVANPVDGEAQQQVPPQGNLTISPDRTAAVINDQTADALAALTMEGVDPLRRQSTNKPEKKPAPTMMSRPGQPGASAQKE